MDAGAAAEADAGAPPRKKAAERKRWADEDARSTAAPREDGGKEAALAECAVSCCLFCACLPVALLCCVARAPVRAARRCWRLRSRSRRPARRLAPGGSSSFSDAELGDFVQGRRRAMAGEDEDGRGRSRPGPPPPAPAPPPQQPPPRDRGRS
ncbi:uncharacterized protein [Lolium perenne]|uniref:uncharacterized protein n=1 Tax=Lolium perenne TaxID=4522 RepID=UPI0021F5DED7|nr:uncharacterized protein LOC127343430 [Lolium perenne]